MQYKPHHWFLLTLTFIGGFSTSAGAVEWPVFGPVKMEALFNYDQWKRETETVNSDEYELRAGFSFDGEGYWLDPGILRFNYYLEPIYNIGEYSSETFLDKRDGYSLNYNINVDLLQGTTLPVDSNFFFRQVTSSNTSSFGQRTETDLTHNSVSLNWKNTYFPLVFRFDNRDVFTVNERGGDQPSFIRDEVEQVYSIKGRSTKTYMELVRRVVDDRVKSRNNDFDINHAILRHHFLWGKGSRLDSRFDYYDRTGFNAVERIGLTEVARIQHNDDFDSLTRYSYRSSKQTFDTVTNTGSYTLRHKLYRNLDTAATILGEDIQSDDVHQVETQVGLKLGYQKSNFFRGDVNIRGAANYSVVDRDSSAGFQEIIDETHQVPLAGNVILNKRFVASPTIVVTDVTSTVVFVEGLDYDVIPITDNLTQIFVIPGGAILSGSILLVSYKALILPSVKYSSINSTVGFSYRIGLLNFSHYETKLSYDVISGIGGDFLTDTRDKVTRMEINWETRRTNNQFSAERRYYRNGDFAVTTDTFTQTSSYHLNTNIQMNLSLTGSFTENNVEAIDVYVLDFNIIWRPTPYWTIRPTIGAWTRKTDRNDTSNFVADEDILSASLNVRWSYRQIYLDLILRHNDRTADGAEFIDDNVYLNLRRRFW